MGEKKKKKKKGGGGGGGCDIKIKIIGNNKYSDLV